MLVALLAVLAAASVEVEITAGAAVPVSSSEFWNPGSYPAAPMIRASASLPVSPRISAGLSLAGVLGGEGRDHKFEPAAPEAGFEAWSALATMRAHVRPAEAPIEETRVDFYVQGGAGIGQVIGMQVTADVEHAWLRGRAAPTFELELGGNYLVNSGWSLGLQGTWAIWTRVGQDAYELGGGQVNAPVQSSIVVTAVFLAATVAFRSPL